MSDARLREITDAGKRLVESVEYDVNGLHGQGGNGGLTSDQTLRCAGALRIIISRNESGSVPQALPPGVQAELTRLKEEVSALSGRLENALQVAAEYHSKWQSIMKAETSARHMYLQHTEHLTTRAETAESSLATVTEERDALIEQGLKCCAGTPNSSLRKFDLAMSFIDSTNTARKAADTLWKEYKARAETAESSLASVTEERDRLWEALARIDALDEADGHNLTVNHAFEAVEIARAALTPKEPAHD